MDWKRVALRLILGAAVFVGVAVVAQPEHGPASSRSGAAHDRLACTQCHPAVADIGGKISAKNPAQSCRSCHGLVTENELIANTFHRDNSRNCNDCHSFHETSLVSAGGTEFVFSRHAGFGLCAACHNEAGGLGALSEGHRIASRLFHSNNDLMKGQDASQACMICHSENRTVQIDGLSIGQIPQFNERHTHPLGEIKGGNTMRNGTRVRSDRDPRLHLFNDRIECQTCHQLNAATKYRLVEFESQQELCRGCHEFE